MRNLALIAGAIVGVLLVGAIVAWSLFVGFVATPPRVDGSPSLVVVPEHIRPAELARLLGERSIVTNERAFLLYLERFRRNTVFLPGEYELGANMSPAQIVDRLAAGEVMTYVVTIDPGVGAAEVVSRLAEAGLGDRDALLAELDSAGAAAALGVPAPRLEGYLFPDAYTLPRGLAPRVLLGRLVERFRTAVGAELQEAAQRLGLGPHEVLTLASLIEKEDVRAEERTQLSAVFHNRLKSKMKLESRASVAYGLGKPESELSHESLANDHPYNTFARRGLPAGPIANPSLSAILAAARPAKSDALYFAPRGDGTHVFCPDAICHRIAVERWEAEQAKEQAGMR